MVKYASVADAAIYLHTTKECITVTACDYKKKHGQHPLWYQASNRKVNVDIGYLFKLRDREMLFSAESSEFYYTILDDLNINAYSLAGILSNQSEIYNKVSSWRNFLQHTLFTEPKVKFHDRISRLSEFHRIASQLVEEYECQSTNLEK